MTPTSCKPAATAGAKPAPILLRGITWKHTRGLLPMLATAQRFEETHPGVRIAWETRSLQAFADEPLDVLARKYDLLVVDHPSSGLAAATGCLAPLNEALDAACLRDQETHQVGQSYASYVYEGHLWALPIDAATPVSACRPDLLAAAGEREPANWEELMHLARRGLVAVPGLAIDSLMHFFMLCHAFGEEPLQSADRVVAADAGVEALRCLRALLDACDRACLERNPIAIWEMLAASDRAAYCPFAYGYSNYSREGYARHCVQAGELVTLRGERLRSTLGGAGLAISATCSHADVAAEYAAYVASATCQSTLYFEAGGQPGHRAAWLSDEVNRRSNGFFARTLPVLDRAWVRPRFDGYLDFQHDASQALHAYLQRGGSEIELLDAMKRMLANAHRTDGKEKP